MSQTQRQRKFHHRSRTGCVTCKSRHVRCDESKPVCNNCLRIGANCGFLQSSSSTSLSPSPSPNRLGSGTPRRGSPTFGPPVGGPAGSRYLNAVPNPVPNPQAVFPVAMSASAQRLFQTCLLEAHQRISDHPGAPELRDSFIVQRALSEPGFLHASLLLSAIQWLWQTGNFEALRSALLLHKSEANQYLLQSLKDPQKASHDSTIATITSMALVEASLWETNGGGVAAIHLHLRGMQRIMNPPVWNAAKGGKPSLFQRTMRMATSRMSSSSADCNLKDFHKDRYLPALICLRFKAKWPLAIHIHQQEGLGMGNDTSGRGRVASPVPVTQNASFSGVPTNPEDFASFKVISRCSWLSAFLYMADLLQPGSLSSFILNWLIELFREDAARTERYFLEGTCDRNGWFWMMMFALSAVESAMPVNDLEMRQIAVWRRDIADRIRLANAVLGLGDWEDARSCLRVTAWKDGFDGEQELKQLWERISGFDG